MKILKSTVIQAATIQIEDWEKGYSENRYAVLWKAKDEENRYSARSLQDAEEQDPPLCQMCSSKASAVSCALDSSGKIDFTLI